MRVLIAFSRSHFDTRVYSLFSFGFGVYFFALGTICYYVPQHLQLDLAI